MDSLSRRSFLATLFASGAVVACGADGTVDSRVTTTSARPSPQTVDVPSVAVDLGQVETVAHSYERVPADPGTVAAAGIVAADRKLAVDLFTLISEAEAGNFMFSPYSIGTAFSMVEAGAESETEAQMRAVLGIAVPDADWHAGRNALDEAIRTPVNVPVVFTPLELEITNTQFGQTGFGFVDEFVQLLAEEYGVDVNAVDFVSDPEVARLLINAWVAEKTRDRITALLPDGSIDEMVRFVLINTVFFKADWRDQFDPDLTTSEPFRLLDGTTVNVEMMQGGSRTTYGEGDGWQMVRLWYWGGYSMTLILPATDRFDEIADRLSGGLLDEISDLESDHQVTLSIPKFSFATPVDLIPLFQSLGMIDAFDPQKADFSGMSTADKLFISGGFHQATIEVDEFGTTATAATAAVGSVLSQPQPAELNADRPFLFVIEHNETGEPLFMGRVINPNT